MNKATRDGFGDQLMECAKHDDKIVIISADLTKATKVDQFAKLYPDRFFDVGIAENNMIGIASGLSEHGYKVFITSFSAFLTGKYDTIRCSLAYSKCPVTIVGTHGGMAIGRDGVTQMGLEDVAIMRALPNMIILNPATYIEARAITKYICEYRDKVAFGGKPIYLRLGRQPVEEVFSEDYIFDSSHTSLAHSILKVGDKGVIFSTGCILPDVLKAVEDINISVINIPVLKPIDEFFILQCINHHKYVFTIEDHSVVGGLGSIIAEVMAEKAIGAKLKRIGVQDIFPESGKPEDLYEKYGLSSNKIKETILDTLKS